MKARIAAYLEKRAVRGPWTLSAVDTRGITQAVVIPALAEEQRLFDTLGDLAANGAADVARSLVICVVNNRATPHARAEDIADNLRTLARLEALRKDTPLRLAYVDAASPGKELPRREGVGLARKIGLDLALSALHGEGADGPLLSLDADTRVSPDYLATVRAHFDAEPAPWAAVVAYAHPLDGAAAGRDAIVAYELFLRVHELGLRRAGSPYAYPAIGSTIICSRAAYVSAGGMKRRLAAEDFYFLQDLRKGGAVHRIPGTVVQPSARPSHRVPFGTGATIVRQVQPGAEAQHLYAVESYQVLERFLAAADHNPDAASETLSEAGGSEALEAFLEAQGFPGAWKGIQRNARSAEQRRAQFHRWMDAFRTMKLFHHLRDYAHPDTALEAGLPALLDWCGVEKTPGGPIALLEHLRATWAERGLWPHPKTTSP